MRSSEIILDNNSLSVKSPFIKIALLLILSLIRFLVSSIRMGPLVVSGVSASLSVFVLNNKKYGETREPVSSEDVLGCPCSLGRPIEGPV